jgi:hypothetical protein
MVDFAQKLKENKAIEKLYDVFDLQYMPTEREKRFESFILAINESLRGSQSPEVKNAAVKELRRLSKIIAAEIYEREQNKIK